MQQYLLSVQLVDEYIGGFWVIKAQDLDAAPDRAAEGAAACGSPVEVRPFQEVDED
jgi:hypothetical protein